jgi:hypothetical protein
VTRTVTRAALVGLLALSAVNCGGAPAAGRAPSGAGQEETAQRDAQPLGREVLELMDRVADYRASHGGRSPRTLRQVGVDSLTATTFRHLVDGASGPAIVVGYRQPGNRAVSECRGDTQVLEEASLSHGRFPVACTGLGGETSFEIGGQ